jgi:hypothetical protein
VPGRRAGGQVLGGGLVGGQRRHQQAFEQRGLDGALLLRVLGQVLAGEQVR